ncbi:MAG: energy transducer TonB [Sulfurimonas sp.]|nr:energy transducer TonB [Sulfurimonas sp.]
MNRSSFALFVALLIHFLLILIFWLLGSMVHDVNKPIKSKEERIKISLKEMPKKLKNDALKKQAPKPSKKAPPMPKGKQLKKIVKQSKVTPIKKSPIKYEQKKIKQKKKVKKPPINPTKPKPIVKPKPKVKLLPPIKPYLFLPPKKSENKYNSYDWLSEDKSSQEVKKKKIKVKSKNNINNSNIKELYGDEFGKLSAGQQKYILDNQEIMRRITQQVLNRVARVNLTKNLNVNRVNIIEFYLHPNGDITDFKFLKKSGYYILDKTTKETIEYAYSRYPKASEKTLIRYNVFYDLARY